MRYQSLVFSNQPLFIFARHSLFWLVYGAYFYFQSLSPGMYYDLYAGMTFHSAFISLCCFLPVCILAVYLCLCLVLPATLERKRYLGFGICVIALYLLGTCVNYFSATLFYQYTNQVPNGYISMEQKIMKLAVCNTKWAVVVAAIAAGIRLAKKGYRQQKEHTRMTASHARLQVKLEKARVYPGFLLRSLHTLQSFLVSRKPDAPELILQLSDLLSYTLYKNEVTLAELAEELAELAHLFYIESLPSEGTDARLITHTADIVCFVPPGIFIHHFESLFDRLQQTNNQWKLVAKLAAGNDRLTMDVVCTVTDSSGAARMHVKSFVSTEYANSNRYSSLLTEEVTDEGNDVRWRLSLPVITQRQVVPQSVTANTALYEPA